MSIGELPVRTANEVQVGTVSGRSLSVFGESAWVRGAEQGRVRTVREVRLVLGHTVLVCEFLSCGKIK
jgi:hypothetical protein